MTADDRTKLRQLLAEYDAVPNKRAGVGGEYPADRLKDALLEHAHELLDEIERLEGENVELREFVVLAKEYCVAYEGWTILESGASRLEVAHKAFFERVDALAARPGGEAS